MENHLSESSQHQAEILWDGSHLGNYPESIISYTMKVLNTNMKYCRLNINELTIFCSLRKSKEKKSATKILALIDELKPIFGLRKVGSHTITISSRLYIIYNVNLRSYNDIIADIPISCTNYREAFEREGKINTERDIISKMNSIAPLFPSLKEKDLREIAIKPEIRRGPKKSYDLISEELDDSRKKFLFEMRKLLIFRAILAMDTNMSHILLRDGLPISLKDNFPIDKGEKPIDSNFISQSHEKAWFSTISRDEVFEQMIGDLDRGDLREAARKVSKRIYPKTDRVASIIIQRVSMFFPPYQE